MNSKVNFHGQEIDLEKVAQTSTHWPDYTFKNVFNIKLHTEYGYAYFFFVKDSSQEAVQLQGEFCKLQTKYEEFKKIETKIAEQWKVVETLNTEAISVNKKLSDARKEVHRLQRIKDDYR